MNWIITGGIALGTAVGGFMLGKRMGKQDLARNIAIKNAVSVETLDVAINMARNDCQAIVSGIEKAAARKNELYSAEKALKESQKLLEKLSAAQKAA